MGGDAKYVLIGGAVKELGEHILTRLCIISLESAVRKSLSIIIVTSPLVRKRRKRVQPQKKKRRKRNLPLLDTRASLQLNPLCFSSASSSLQSAFWPDVFVWPRLCHRPLPVWPTSDSPGMKGTKSAEDMLLKT